MSYDLSFQQKNPEILARVDLCRIVLTHPSLFRSLELGPRVWGERGVLILRG